MPAAERRVSVLLSAASLLPLTMALGGCSDDRQPTTAVVRVDDPTAAGDIPNDPAKAASENGIAADLIDRGKLGDAADALDRALIADPRFGPAQNNRGIVQMRLGHPLAAADAFNRAAELMPHAPAPRNNLGLLMESSDRFDDAVRCYDAAVALAPDVPEYTGNAVRARVRRGDQTDELRQMLTRVATTDPRPDWALWARQTLSKWSRPTTDPS